MSAYDAMYVSLAEAIEATIVTCDNPLAKALGRRTRIEGIAWALPDRAGSIVKLESNAD
jgi:hypothetical protein